MKKSNLTLVLVLMFTSLAFAQNTLKLNPQKSKIHWKGSMLLGFGGHEGTVNFKSGTVKTQNGKIKGGTFVVDMNTIVNTDGGYSPDLVGHLKNEDFFDVRSFPQATLMITAVEQVDAVALKLDANLTIKGITNPVELYNVKFYEKESKMTVKFKIDRTDWKINYGTKGIAKVKNNAISDIIEFDVEVAFN